MTQMTPITSSPSAQLAFLLLTLAATLGLTPSAGAETATLLTFEVTRSVDPVGQEPMEHRGTTRVWIADGQARLEGDQGTFLYRSATDSQAARWLHVAVDGSSFVELEAPVRLEELLEPSALARMVAFRESLGLETTVRRPGRREAVGRWPATLVRIETRGIGFEHTVDLWLTETLKNEALENDALADIDTGPWRALLESQRPLLAWLGSWLDPWLDEPTLVPVLVEERIEQSGLITRVVRRLESVRPVPTPVAHFEPPATARRLPFDPSRYLTVQTAPAPP